MKCTWCDSMAITRRISNVPNLHTTSMSLSSTKEVGLMIVTVLLYYCPGASPIPGSLDHYFSCTLSRWCLLVMIPPATWWCSHLMYNILPASHQEYEMHLTSAQHQDSAGPWCQVEAGPFVPLRPARHSRYKAWRQEDSGGKYLDEYNSSLFLRTVITSHITRSLKQSLACS